MPELTQRQEEIYGYIVDHINQHQRPPTVRAIQKHFKIGSANGVMCHLESLEKKGFIKREPFTANGITVPGLISVQELNRQLKEARYLIRWLIGRQRGISADQVTNDDVKEVEAEAQGASHDDPTAAHEAHEEVQPATVAG